jgi:pimeloyl-ACP methyl ester carboxylesterase
MKSLGEMRGSSPTKGVILLAGMLAVAMTLAVGPSAQTDRPLQRIAVNGGELEYEVNGTGEPVLLIHGTGVAATFAPTMTQPSLAGYRLIRFHRRGFAGSSRSPVPFSMKDQAADAVALLKALGVQRAHIVGHSFGGCVTLQLALDSPGVAHSLIVMEPPIFNPDGPSPFAKLEALYNSGDKLGAMSAFSTASYGAEWRTLAARVPGGPPQVEKDVDTVFQSEAPAMTKWRFGPEEGARMTQPIIYLTGGGRHGASRERMQMWIKGMEQFVIPNTTHAMLMEDPKGVADAIAAFLKQHPLK